MTLLQSGCSPGWTQKIMWNKWILTNAIPAIVILRLRCWHFIYCLGEKHWQHWDSSSKVKERSGWEHRVDYTKQWAPNIQGDKSTTFTRNIVSSFHICCAFCLTKLRIHIHSSNKPFLHFTFSYSCTLFMVRIGCWNEVTKTPFSDVFFSARKEGWV